MLAATDLVSNGYGTPWGHSRSFASRPANDTDVGQGWNWQIAEWPILEFYGNGMVAVTGRANQTLWFQQQGSSFVPQAGITATLTYDSTSNLYTLTDKQGNVTQFNGTTLLFSKFTDPAGNVTQVTSYVNSGQNIGETQRSYTDGSGNTTIESLLYAYTAGSDGVQRLSSVTLRRQVNGGAWNNVRQALYTYWDGTNSFGSVGDLQTVVTQAWESGAWTSLGTTLYRYYVVGSSSSSASSSSSSGSPSVAFHHALKYVVEPDSYVRLAADPNAGTNPVLAPDWVVALYADNYFQYDSSRRVSLEMLEGGSRSYSYAYTQSSFSPDYNHWATKTVETLPGGTQNITYANYVGQVMLSVKVPGSGQPGNGPWYQFYAYDNQGRVVLFAESSAISGYSEASPDLLNCQPASSGSSSSSSSGCSCATPACAGSYQYLANNAGLVHIYDYDSTSGYPMRERTRNGQCGCDNKLWEKSYGTQQAGGLTVYPLTQEVRFRDCITVDPNQSYKITTNYNYTWYSGTVRVQSMTTTWPVISTAQNGSGVAATRIDYQDVYGKPSWSMDERGFIQYQNYDPVTGGLLQKIDDYNTNLSQGLTPPAGWSTPSGGGLNLVTDYTVDSLGRNIQTLGPSHTISLAGVATTIRSATWTVYQDSLLQTWTGQGYATGTAPNYTYTLVNPVNIGIFDEEGRVTDEIQAIRSYTNGPLLSTDSFPQSSYCRWTTNQYTDCCKLASTRVYFSIPSSGTGTQGVNYNETDFGYDFLNRQNRVVAPGGTITRTVFDARDKPTSVWVGTNDNGATWNDPTGGGAQGNNMVVVSEYQYDGGLAGLDGNRTQVTQHVDSQTTHVTNFSFDWRNRQIKETAAQDWYSVTTLDNLDRPTQVQQYAQATGYLIHQSQTLYDDRSNVYQSIRYAVDPTTGTVGNSLVDNTWFDPSGNTLCSLPAGSSAFTKSVYDGAGRETVQYSGYYLGSTSYSWAGSVANDTIMEQVETTYDAGSNVTLTATRQRFHNATGTGALTYPGGAQPQARVTYTVNYPDGIGRSQAVANYGTNGDVALTPPATIPASSASVLVTSTLYNSRGEANESLDSAGTVTYFIFDDAGRKTQEIRNYQGSSSSSSSSSASLPVSDDQNNTIQWTYTADGLVATLMAVNAATGNQSTTFHYGTTLAASDVARNDVLGSITYPDGGVVSYLVNRQGQVKQFTDQRGVVHAYSFDLLGRQTQDAVTSFLSSSSSSSSGSGAVDSTIQRLQTTYEVRGMIQNVTSYNSPTVGQGTVVNDVQRAYNAFGQLVTEYQEHSGTVNTSTSLNVQYQYANGSANTIRPTGVIYPNGRVLNLNYGTSGGADDALSRIASLIDNDGVTHLADYTRLGAASIVQLGFAQPGINYSLINGSGADPYTGLDQFSRVVDCRWYATGSGTDVARIQHGYDLTSNRLWRKDTVAESQSAWQDELYSYEALYRLSELQRGELNSSNNGLVAGTLDFAQAWGLDATGNWGQFWENDTGSSWNLQQTRTASKANEITGISGGSWIVPAYDAAGNMITMPQPASPTSSYSATYDAWNRLISLWSGGSLVQQNAYDGVNRRATKLVSGTTRHYYYSNAWQILEERLGSSTSYDRQFVWGLRYLDDLVLRDSATYGRLFGLQDPNFNVVAICNTTGTVQERYRYSAYGEPGFLTSAFAARSSSAFGWETIYAGYRWDAESALYDVRNRDYDPLTSWLGRDPLALRDRRALNVPPLVDINLYQYVVGNPASGTDPLGLLGGGFGACLSLPQCCFPVWSSGIWCVGMCVGGNVCFREGVCCKNNQVRHFGQFEVCVTATVNVNIWSCPVKCNWKAWWAGVKKLFTTWPGGKGKPNVFGFTGCPDPGCSGRFCFIGSVSVLGHNVGCRVCGGHGGQFTTICGYGIGGNPGTGVGIGGQGCISCIT